MSRARVPLAKSLKIFAAEWHRHPLRKQCLSETHPEKWDGYNVPDSQLRMHCLPERDGVHTAPEFNIGQLETNSPERVEE